MESPCSFRRVGASALLVELSDLDAVRAYDAEARRRQASGGLGGEVEIVPAARTILFDGVEDPGGLAREIGSWHPDGEVAAPARTLEIPVRYDGPDLGAVAAMWDMSLEAAVALHSSLAHRVAFLGFSPGFAYLSGLGTHRVARRASPRPEVPAGSVAVADEFSGVYPRPSPGGWQLIGTTSLELWSPDRERPALLAPGDAVRFVPVSS